MSRVQLALNVADLDEAVSFYTALFGTEPAKRHPGYANFTVADPPLKLVLIEDPGGQPSTLNHLGVEVRDADQVRAAVRRFDTLGLSTTPEAQVTCCFALQDKAWVKGPGGEEWEFYAVLADVAPPEGMGGGGGTVSGVGCCGARQLETDGNSSHCC